MSIDIGTVLKAGSSYRIADLLGNAHGQSLLEKWYGDSDEPPRCDCSPLHPKLSIVLWSNTGYLSLRAYPNTKQDHHIRCRFGGFTSPLNQESQFSQSAIRIDQSTGEIRITGEFPIRHLRATRHDSTIPCSLSPNRYRRNKMSGLGLLQELWLLSNLTYGSPAHLKIQDWHGVVERLGEVARRVRYNKTPLRDVLAFAGSTGAWIDKRYFFNTADRYRNDPKKRFLVIFPFKSFEKAKFGHKVNFKGSWISVYIDDDVMDDAISRFDCFAGNSDNKLFSIGIGSVEWVNNRSMKMINIAGMPITRRFIPVDSSFDNRVVEALILERGEFSKSLKVLDEYPYSVMHDTQKNPAMEVFGMMSLDAYKDHAQVKTDYYHTTHIPLWVWNTSTTTIPPFPAR